MDRVDVGEQSLMSRRPSNQGADGLGLGNAHDAIDVGDGDRDTHLPKRPWTHRLTESSSLIVVPAMSKTTSSMDISQSRL